jgi:hypothetical protein
VLWTFHADTETLPEHSPQNKPDNFCLTDTGLEEAMRVEGVASSLALDELSPGGGSAGLSLMGSGPSTSFPTKQASNRPW